MSSIGACFAVAFNEGPRGCRANVVGAVEHAPHSSLGEGAVLGTLVTFFRLRKCLTLARRESGQVSLEAVRDIQLYLDKDATVRFLIKALIIELVTLGILQSELGVSELNFGTPFCSSKFIRMFQLPKVIQTIVIDTI